MLNNSNMDFTFINDAFACVAYVLGYLTKNETQISEALKNIDETVTKFESVFDRCRECSLQEASYRILGLDMVGGSRTLKVIVASQPKYRDALLKPICKKK